jgi:cytochrome c peroxidase
MRRKVVSALFSLLPFAAITSCNEYEATVDRTYYPGLPAKRFDYNNGSDVDNSVSTLGRVLFYDKALSGNNTISCASCHKQSLGFADNRSFSKGANGKMTERNAMALQNLVMVQTVAPNDSVDGNAGYGSVSTGPVGGLFWDGRESFLDIISTHPLLNTVEMGNTDLETVARKIANLPYYRPLFDSAFGYQSAISPNAISTAIGFFISDIKSQNSRFDQFNFARNNNLPTDQILSSLEMEGMSLFNAVYNCNSCHRVELASQPEARFTNIGLDMEYHDEGLTKTTSEPGDVGKFKVPSLRNVELTAPYMHDGRFSTLEEVIEHYSGNIVNHPNLHPDLKDENGLARKMNIPEHDRQALIAFLRSLTDKSLLDDVRFSDPFRERK